MRLWYFLEFIILYLWDLTLGAFRVAQDVVTPQNLSTPGIIKFPLEVQSDFEIALLSNLITFSPGTMVIDLDADKKHLFIHMMFLENEEEAIKEFKEVIESRVLRILRGASNGGVK
ncbi:Na+/H+ antiporter subunit E [Halobacteriovorax sp. RT-2-6]|uniref:Na+/H+ antiporter subunit E n=1 Tax=unclassified Halobacteriovorax TaxID=2639665 RepID=UPI00399A74DE